MADRTLVWHIPKGLWKNVEGENVSTEYVLDDDYLPVRVHMSQKEAQAGAATIVDINQDGSSIFPSTTLQPALAQGLLTSEWDVFLSTLGVMQEGGVITLDVDQVSETVPGSKLTVSLELEKA